MCGKAKVECEWTPISGVDACCETPVPDSGHEAATIAGYLPGVHLHYSGTGLRRSDFLCYNSHNALSRARYQVYARPKWFRSLLCGEVWRNNLLGRRLPDCLILRHSRNKERFQGDDGMMKIGVLLMSDSSEKDEISIGTG